MSHHQNAGKSHEVKIANKSLENVANLKILEMTSTNQICIHEEIKRD
jgi:hypothetical protein